MKVVSLNLWGGKLFEPLMKSIRDWKSSTDIFCFQEVFFGSVPGTNVLGARDNLFQELGNELSGFGAYKWLAPEGVRFGLSVPEGGVRLGLAMFVKNGLNVSENGGFSTWPLESDNDPTLKLTGNVMYVDLEKDGTRHTIANIHGIWQPEGKDDTPQRLYQSEKILEFFNGRNGKKIICGDFNLRPSTRSIAMLDKAMNNLIKKNNIVSTRNRYYKDMEKFDDPIADYAFVSPGVNVKSFSVPGIEVSDHLPLTLDFD